MIKCFHLAKLPQSFSVPHDDEWSDNMFSSIDLGDAWADVNDIKSNPCWYTNLSVIYFASNSIAWWPDHWCKYGDICACVDVFYWMVFRSSFASFVAAWVNFASNLKFYKPYSLIKIGTRPVLFVFTQPCARKPETDYFLILTPSIVRVLKRFDWH